MFCFKRLTRSVLQQRAACLCLLATMPYPLLLCITRSILCQSSSLFYNARNDECRISSITTDGLVPIPLRTYTNMSDSASPCQTSIRRGPRLTPSVAVPLGCIAYDSQLHFEIDIGAKFHRSRVRFFGLCVFLYACDVAIVGA